MNPKITIVVDAKNKAIASLTGIVSVGAKVDVEVSGLPTTIPDWLSTDKFTGKSLRLRIVDECGKDIVRYPLVEKSTDPVSAGDTWTAGTTADSLVTSSGCFVNFDTHAMRNAFCGVAFNDKQEFGIILDSIVDSAEYATGRIKIAQWSHASSEDPTILPDWRATLAELNTKLGLVDEAVSTATTKASEASTARDQAMSAKSSAESSANASLAHANNSAASASSASASATSAANSASAAEDAQEASESAQEAAETAASHYPYIDANGHWKVWENGAWVDKGAAKGDKGDAATVAVHSTETLSAGSSAEVINMGTSGDANFKFRIPRGADGANGIAATIAVHSTSTGAAGTNASVENMGTATNASFKFVIPKGDKGDTGGHNILAGKTFSMPKSDKERNNLLAYLIREMGGNIADPGITPGTAPHQITMTATDGTSRQMRVVKNDLGEYTTEVE